MKEKSILAVLLLLVAGLQTAWAQKMIVTLNDSSKVTYSLSQVKEVTFEEPKNDGHAWVDLGLPSGTLWATCNVGANSPEEYGDYFAWGETEPKDYYQWDTYRWMNAGQSSNKQINKYTFADGWTDGCWYSNGTFIGDNKTELDPEDDAATANWGSSWQMPSLAQIQELFNYSYTTAGLRTQNGVRGYEITSNSNGNSIFLPLAGSRDAGRLIYVGIRGQYWSRSLSAEWSWRAYFMNLLDLAGYSEGHWYEMDRCFSRSVRPVRVP